MKLVPRMQPIAMLRTGIWNLVIAAGLLTPAGCQSLTWPDVWPFPEAERTTYLTPAMRVDTIRQVAAQADDTASPRQSELTDQLARQIQIEPDALVRKAIIEAMGEFRTPLAQQVLEAGTSDSDASVRIAACQALGKRGEARSIDALAKSLRADRDIDVRLAAAEALGNIKSPASVKALAVALDDHDPAMQYVGVQSMKSITGEDYGGDVQAWRQYAAGETPPHPQAPSIATRLKNLSPF
jgi:HEAT repeats